MNTQYSSSLLFNQYQKIVDVTIDTEKHFKIFDGYPKFSQKINSTKN